MLLLQNQLEIESTNLERLQSFGEFIAVFYSSMWFQTPLASEAAYIDLGVLQKNVGVSSLTETQQYF